MLSTPQVIKIYQAAHLQSVAQQTILQSLDYLFTKDITQPMIKHKVKWRLHLMINQQKHKLFSKEIDISEKYPCRAIHGHQYFILCVNGSLANQNGALA